MDLLIGFKYKVLDSFYLFLAASGLSCHMWDLSLWCMDFSLVVAWGLSCLTACGILVPWPGIKPMSPTLKGGFLSTTGKSPVLNFLFVVCVGKLILYVPCAFSWHDLFVVIETYRKTLALLIQFTDLLKEPFAYTGMLLLWNQRKILF